MGGTLTLELHTGYSGRNQVMTSFTWNRFDVMYSTIEHNRYGDEKVTLLKRKTFFSLFFWFF